MAKTAVRVDTQVKGKVLNLGGVVTGFFEGDGNGDGKIILTNANGVDQVILDAGATGFDFQGDFTGNVSVGGLTITGPATNILVENFGTADLNTVDVLRPDGAGGLLFDQLDSTDVGLGNVTNDAQLKRAAADFDTFGEKTVPDADDIVLIEDSVLAAFDKKKVKLSNISSAGLVLVNNSQTDKNSSGFAEIFGFQINLRKAFPAGLVFQIKSFNSGSGVQGRYRIFNITDSVTLATVDNTLSDIVPTIYESSTIASGSIPDAVKEYSVEHTRLSGTGAAAKTSLIGALLRKP